MACRVPIRIAAAKFPGEVRPLVAELTRRLGDGLGPAPRLRDSTRVEAISPRRRLVVDPAQVGSDRRDRVARIAESRQLRMVTVTARSAEEPSLREERFPPERYEAPGVEVPGVEGPEPQKAGRRSSFRASGLGP